MGGGSLSQFLSFGAFNGDSIVVLRDGTEVAASRRYRHRLDALFG
jgi:hypothetical protein